MGTEGVYFFHIPKTAGMSVWRFLEQAFPADGICPWWLWDQLIDIPRAELDRWQVFRGHFLSHLEPYLARPLKTFTVLRDPVDRTISHYFHVRRAPDHPYYSHAQGMSLAEFCLHPETRHMVENYQAAYLAKSPLDPAAAKQDLEPLTLQQRMEYPDYIPDTAELLERAQARLNGFAAVGITEDLNASLLKISNSLDFPKPKSIERQNANPEGTSAEHIDERTLALIRDLTEVDRRLYESVSSASQLEHANSSKANGPFLKPMITYAQNFEDVILRRVFDDRSHGFYIDVGAMDPIFDSVTNYFYEQGWSGINIEPNEWFYKKLLAGRPRDINLNVAAGERQGSRAFYVFEQYGNSTFDESSRDRFAEKGYDADEKIVEITTLATICNKYVTGPIDFLKIDCEGWEKMAIEGADWDRFRPTVVIVEATEPGTTLASWAEWQPILENAQYEMVYFDGVNRFFLHRDWEKLRCHFGSPPNVFDDFRTYATVVAQQTSEGLRNEREGLRKEREGLTARVAELEQDLLRARLWIGQLSQELAASRKRSGH